jgi:hypothetical protein
MYGRRNAIEEMARLYARRYQHRAVILVSDNISRALGGGHWDRAQRWHEVRSRLWQDYGTVI